MSDLSSGRRELTVEAGAEEETVLMLLGGEPVEEEIVMWWNVIGRSHEEIVEQRGAATARGSHIGRGALGAWRTSRATGCWRPDADDPAQASRQRRLAE